MATGYTLSHPGLPDEARRRISTRYYGTGHMMYVNQEAPRKMKADVAEFLSEP